ncbi:uncharacterized protein UV8b_02167 [Ustilaginoidea virens]|uniref:Pre-mRNA splicing factor CLF1 n=2 Tax=Ustilaginoidea virens TaxID=1159556 RepID=A0A8E5MFB7_USTVR|nr:uncharacterized protein UV8b_02167 [Ustilaginoidea virens]QUC17926.1 hypothetical protein UV8b_02167 [Ustilaginoidea virens]
MAVPKPPTSLDQSCTVIHNNTLYSYSPDGFASIRLEDGAEWEKLAMGVKVTGAACVGSERPKNVDPSFFVVGGQATSDDYTGLQKFTYSTGKWATIKPTNLVTKHRQYHTSTYIEAMDSILVFGGNQDGRSGPSSQTFSIQASEPYTVKSFDPSTPPNNPPPSFRPIVSRWTDSNAIMVGGGTGMDNAKVFFFNSDVGWRFSGASLAQPLDKDTQFIRGVSVTGTDGSTSLLFFDLSQSPNKVTRVVVQDGSGKPVLNSPAIVGRNAARAGKRSLTLGNWPEYDSTLAPGETRQNYAIAQAPDGMVVISGGNADHPIALFNTTENSWVNATSFFSRGEQKLLAVTSTTSSTVASTTSHTSSTSFSSSTAASSSSAVASAAAAAVTTQGDNTDAFGPSSNAILGITLGSIAGFLMFLGLVLLCIRRGKKILGNKEDANPNALPDEKDVSSWSKPVFCTSGPFRGHRPQASAESNSSVAILMGRMNKEKAGVARKSSNDTTRSSVSSVHKQFKSTISKPIPHALVPPALEAHDERGVAFSPPVAEPRPRNGQSETSDGTRRSSGWNRYWSGGSALQIIGYGNGKRATTISEQSSRYSEAAADPRVTQDSATVPPLNFDGRARVNSVNSGSPVVAESAAKMPFTEGMSGTIERPVSAVSSGYSSGIPESIIDVWDPAEANKPWGANRAPSEAYTAGTYQTNEDTRDSRVRPPPSGVSKQPQLATGSISDMSWLNLGDHSGA